MKMNGTLGLWDKVGFGMEEALAWFIESGAIGGLIVMGFLATVLGIGR